MAARNLPGTQWLLIMKVDSDEAYAEVRSCIALPMSCYHPSLDC